MKYKGNIYKNTLMIQSQRDPDGDGYYNNIVVGSPEPSHRGYRIEGYELNIFKSNPIGLFNHDYDQPVGKWRNVRENDKGELVGDFKFSSTQTEKETMFQEGVLNAFSTTILSKDVEEQDDGSTLLKENLLLEVSLVSIPDNPLAVAQLFNVEQDTELEEIYSILKMSGKIDIEKDKGIKQIKEISKNEMKSLYKIKKNNYSDSVRVYKRNGNITPVHNNKKGTLKNKIEKITNRTYRRIMNVNI